MKKAFTLIELIIVMSIVLILSAVAITGSANLIRSLRFNNTFNKTVLMVQHARNLAITNKDATVASYRIEISMPSSGENHTAQLVAQKTDNTLLTMDRLKLTATTNLTFFAEPNFVTANCTPAKIEFTSNSGAAKFACAGYTDTEPITSLKIGVQEKPNGAAAAVRSKTFLITQGSGIPQVE